MPHRSLRDRGTTDAIASVAAGNKVTAEHLLLAVTRRKTDLRRSRRDVLNRIGFGLEMNDAACTKAKRDQVLQHLMLCVNRDRATVSEIVKVNSVTAATKAQLDAVVDEAFAFQALACADLDHEVDGRLLEYARADRSLDRVP